MKVVVNIIAITALAAECPLRWWFLAAAVLISAYGLAYGDD